MESDSNTHITIAVLIGNSDNKLTQSEWSQFCSQTRDCIEDISNEIFFSGGSEWDAPWQNACWTISVDSGNLDLLKQRLTTIRKEFKQDYVALLCGSTIFI
jgi:hypothetical protein